MVSTQDVEPGGIDGSWVVLVKIGKTQLTDLMGYPRRALERDCDPSVGCDGTSTFAVASFGCRSRRTASVV